MHGQEDFALCEEQERLPDASSPSMAWSRSQTALRPYLGAVCSLSSRLGSSAAPASVISESCRTTKECIEDDNATLGADCYDSASVRIRSLHALVPADPTEPVLKLHNRQVRIDCHLATVLTLDSCLPAPFGKAEQFLGCHVVQWAPVEARQRVHRR